MCVYVSEVVISECVLSAEVFVNEDKSIKSKLEKWLLKDPFIIK